MSTSDLSPQIKESFLELLERMLSLGDDFTLREDDRQLIRDVAGAPDTPPRENEDILDAFYCKQLEIPPGTTYQAAARRVAEALDIGGD